MVQWLGQRDEFRCGPIALVNIMKWAGIKRFKGHRVNEKLAKGYLSKICKTGGNRFDPDNYGTAKEHFNPVLHSLDLVIEEHKRPTKLNIKGCLKSEGIVLLSSSWWYKKEKAYVEHYCLITDVWRNGKFYTAINNIEGRAEALITGDYLSRMLSRPDSDAYFIWKEII